MNTKYCTIGWHPLSSGGPTDHSRIHTVKRQLNKKCSVMHVEFNPGGHMNLYMWRAPAHYKHNASVNMHIYNHASYIHLASVHTLCILLLIHDKKGLFPLLFLSLSVWSLEPCRTGSFDSRHRMGDMWLDDHKGRRVKPTNQLSLYPFPKFSRVNQHKQ